MSMTIAEADIKVKVDNSAVKRQLDTVRKNTTATTTIIDSKFASTFGGIESGIQKISAQTQAMLKAITGTLTIIAGISVKRAIDQSRQLGTETAKQWDAAKRRIDDALAGIGKYVMQAKILGKTMTEWMDYFSYKLRQVTQEDVQKFVDLLVKAAVTLAAIRATMMGLAMTKGGIDILSKIAVPAAAPVVGQLGATALATGAGVAGARGIGMAGAAAFGGKSLMHPGYFTGRVDDLMGALEANVQTLSPSAIAPAAAAKTSTAGAIAGVAGMVAAIAAISTGIAGVISAMGDTAKDDESEGFIGRTKDTFAGWGELLKRWKDGWGATFRLLPPINRLFDENALTWKGIGNSISKWADSVKAFFRSDPGDIEGIKSLAERMTPEEIEDKRLEYRLKSWGVRAAEALKDGLNLGQDLIEKAIQETQRRMLAGLPLSDGQMGRGATEEEYRRGRMGSMAEFQKEQIDELMSSLTGGISAILNDEELNAVQKQRIKLEETYNNMLDTLQKDIAEVNLKMNTALTNLTKDLTDDKLARMGKGELEELIASRTVEIQNQYNAQLDTLKEQSAVITQRMTKEKEQLDAVTKLYDIQQKRISMEESYGEQLEAIRSQAKSIFERAKEEQDEMRKGITGYMGAVSGTDLVGLSQQLKFASADKERQHMENLEKLLKERNELAQQQRELDELNLKEAQELNKNFKEFSSKIDQNLVPKDITSDLGI